MLTKFKPFSFACSSMDFKEVNSFFVKVNIEMEGGLQFAYMDAVRDSAIEYYNNTMFVREDFPLKQDLIDLGYKTRESVDLNFVRIFFGVHEFINNEILKYSRIGNYKVTVDINGVETIKTYEVE